MTLIRWSTLSTLLAFAVACGNGVSGPPLGFTHAAATFACGPADGPAVAIYLSPDPVQSLEPSGPFVRIYINQAVEQIAGRSWAVGGTSDAAAWFQATPTSYEPAEGGFVITKSVSADKTVEGSVDLTFKNGGHIQGGFRATWISQAGPLCG